LLFAIAGDILNGSLERSLPSIREGEQIQLVPTGVVEIQGLTKLAILHEETFRSEAF
jgi:hypothetical protein